MSGSVGRGRRTWKGYRRISGVVTEVIGVVAEKRGCFRASRARGGREMTQGWI